jgi:hypothetical protein
MNLWDWWKSVYDDLRDKPKPNEPPPFRPPHSWPTDKPIPPWPPKEDRQ